jgi:hypothetical protein
MNKLILIPQFIDRAGRTVYHVYEDDPECRTIRAGNFIGVMRFDCVEDPTWEGVQQELLDG